MSHLTSGRSAPPGLWTSRLHLPSCWIKFRSRSCNGIEEAVVAKTGFCSSSSFVTCLGGWLGDAWSGGWRLGCSAAPEHPRHLPRFSLGPHSDRPPTPNPRQPSLDILLLRPYQTFKFCVDTSGQLAHSDLRYSVQGVSSSRKTLSTLTSHRRNCALFIAFQAVAKAKREQWRLAKHLVTCEFSALV